MIILDKTEQQSLAFAKKGEDRYSGLPAFKVKRVVEGIIKVIFQQRPVIQKNIPTVRKSVSIYQLLYNGYTMNSYIFTGTKQPTCPKLRQIGIFVY
jgi:hypothetical protein